MTAHRFLTKEIAQVEIYGRLCELQVKLKNVSTTGAFIEISRGKLIPQPGDLLRMTIPLNSINKKRILNAEVIWSKGLGLGIRFINQKAVVEKMMSR